MDFLKMHGLGNDFILLNHINPSDHNLTQLAIHLCNRQTGIGADGIVLVLPSEKADIQMRIVNSDGSEPNMCGNAIRCFAKYVYDRQIITKHTFSIETRAGIIIPELMVDQEEVTSVRVNMGSPKFDRQDIPMLGAPGKVINETLQTKLKTYSITSMLMTVPHTMIFVDDLDKVDVMAEGRLIEKHTSFPQGTNVNFVQVLNKNEVKVRTWERGAGATLACGTGSCAAAVASILTHQTEHNVTVHLALGTLAIEWLEETVFMTGPAVNTFSGQISV